jgi:hypothetical protein
MTVVSPRPCPGDVARQQIARFQPELGRVVVLSSRDSNGFQTPHKKVYLQIPNRELHDMSSCNGNDILRTTWSRYQHCCLSSIRKLLP